MRQGNKTTGAVPESADASRRSSPGQGRGRQPQTSEEGRNWLSEPRTAVLVILGAVVLIGGGRRLLQAFRARKAVARLAEKDVSPAEIMAVASFGRAGLHDLFRIFGESPSATHRDAAGRAIASLWGQDELIAEEEQALVRRGYAVTWSARRRYPRAIRAEIPITVTYGLPFLSEDDTGVKPTNLEWSHRLTGARRATLEEFSPWTVGPGRLDVQLIPGDFETSGPHRLALQTRVRTVGLTESWQIELPHIPFNFEFDPRLEPGSLLALPDDVRGETMARSIRLETQGPTEGQPVRFLALSGDMAIRNPPRVVVSTPLPCDLAHHLFLEIDGVAGRFRAGRIILSGQGNTRSEDVGQSLEPPRFDLGPIEPVPGEALDRPGVRRLRVILEADADLGWTDPEVRSIWPGTIETGWVEVELMRL
jgi:hypothetical protein